MPTAEIHPALWLAILSLAEQATRDGLTGLCNRRYFDESLVDQLAIAERYDRPLALVLLDLDRFKLLNDSQGHAAGDAALQAFSEQLKECARAADILCRIGGDEFAVIMPETDATGARCFVERLAQADLPPFSAGIAVRPATDLLADADTDLRTKKAASRP